MPTLDTVLDGLSVAMEEAVKDLTEVLPREADKADNDLVYPHGEILVLSDVRADPWNTDFKEYATDDQGNPVGEIYEARFDPDMQLNIWISVPSEEFDIQTLGSKLQSKLHKYDHNRRSPQDLPDPDGGTLSGIKHFSIESGGELPTEGNNPPLRGYRIDISLRYIDRINTADEEDQQVYFIETVDTPHSGDLTDGSDQDSVAIEYNAS